MIKWKHFYSCKGIDYYVSNKGEVKSHRKVVQTRHPLTYRIRLKTLTRHSTSPRATLYIGDVKFDVAELVATHFVNNPFGYKSVLFLDNNQQKQLANTASLVNTVVAKEESSFSYESKIIVDEEVL